MNTATNFFAVLQLPAGWWKKLVLFGLAAFFINAGVDHFVDPDFYLSIMPPTFPLHSEAVYISGFFEVLGGVCVLIPPLRKIAGWGLVALLVAVYPANIYMALHLRLFLISMLHCFIFVYHSSLFLSIGLTR